jgi:anti-anti-sigma factor
VDSWETEAKMLTHVADARAAGDATVVAGAQDDVKGVAPLKLSQRILPPGEAVANIGGELDIATAEVAVRYVRHLIDRHRGPVIVDLTALSFCDARGLDALLRMAGYAEQAGCPFRVASPSRSLVRVMRITGLDRRFLAPPATRRPIPEDPAGRSMADALRVYARLSDVLRDELGVSPCATSQAVYDDLLRA